MPEDSVHCDMILRVEAGSLTNRRTGRLNIFENRKQTQPKNEKRDF